MQKYLTAILSALLAGSFVHGQEPTVTSNPDASWKILWSASDEFSGEAPDWKKWVKTGNLPETSSWSWDNQKNIETADGVATLTLRYHPKNGRYFSSGILKSYRSFEYGYFEARLRGVKWGKSGACPSFWLYSDFDDKVADGETVYSEIDIVELQQFDWIGGHQDDAKDIDLNLHCILKQDGKRFWRRPKSFPAAQLNKWRAPWHPGEGFHIYGCEVNREEIIWYVDGAEVARKPNLYWHRPKHVALSLGLRKPFVKFQNNRNIPIDPKTDPETKSRLPEFPVSMQVDYVRVWEKEE